MKPEQIEELKKLSGAATPGPWNAGTGHSGRIFGRSGEIAFWSANDDASDWPADVVLACEARNALPTLLREREQLLEALKRSLTLNVALHRQLGEVCLCGACDAARAAIAAAES